MTLAAKRDGPCLSRRNCKGDPLDGALGGGYKRNRPVGLFFSLSYWCFHHGWEGELWGLMQQRSEATRTKITESAIKLFSDRGYDAASVDDICAEAGVSKGAFYHHFESKQALFLTLLNDWLKIVDSAIGANHDRSAPETFTQMASAFPRIFETAGGHLPMILEFWLQASRDEEVWKATIAPYRRYQGYMASLIRRGIAEGSFVGVDPEMASRLIVAAAMGLLLESLMDPKGARWDKVAHDSTTMLLNILLKG